MQGLNFRYMFKSPGRGGNVAHGLRGELYPMICDVFLKARDARKLSPARKTSQSLRTCSCEHWRTRESLR